jgi:hypothetical protein
VAEEYLSQADLARELGVARNTVTVWRARYPDFPVPDVTIGRAPGWLRARLPEIRTWMGTRPGQGAGGGRPRTGS